MSITMNGHDFDNLHGLQQWLASGCKYAATAPEILIFVDHP